MFEGLTKNNFDMNCYRQIQVSDPHPASTHLHVQKAVLLCVDINISKIITNNIHKINFKVRFRSLFDLGAQNSRKRCILSGNFSSGRSRNRGHFSDRLLRASTLWYTFFDWSARCPYRVYFQVSYTGGIAKKMPILRSFFLQFSLNTFRDIRCEA